MVVFIIHDLIMRDSGVTRGRTWRILFVVFALLLILFAVFHAKNVHKKGGKRFDRFYSSNIQGQLDCNPEGSVSGVKLCVDNEEYYFQTYTSETNKNQIFNYLAESGDVVEKAAFSDTLFLVKDGERYAYTFAILN